MILVKYVAEKSMLIKIFLYVGRHYFNCFGGQCLLTGGLAQMNAGSMDAIIFRPGSVSRYMT